MTQLKFQLTLMSAVLMTTASAAAFSQSDTQVLAAANYQQIAFALHPDTEKMLVLDLDRDGLQDLVAIQGHQLNVYFQRNSAPGFDFSAPDAALELPGNAVGWDFPDADNTPALMALIDGQQVLQWQVNNRQFSEAEELIAGLGGFLGKGAYQLKFYQDINNDNRRDLVIPGAGVMNLLIQNTDGSFQAPLSVQADVRQRVVLQAGDELGGETGQSLSIPRVQLRDVNGDQLPDLISDTESRFDVFLASGSADYFPSLPSYSINREAIRERLGEFDVDQLDFSNLTGVLALTHEELLQDMNGDGVDDFILREGGRVALHLGSNTRMNFEQPDQILRSSGNVLSVFLADENEDGRPDLWLWRVDQVSVGDIFLWLAVSGTINLEAFIYPNEGNQFARRPSRRITVALRFPSALRLIGSVQEARERAESMASVIPYERARIMADANTASAAMDDMVILINDQVEVFFRELEPEQAQDDERFLSSLSYERGRDAYEIDLRRVIDAFNVEVNQQVNAARVRDADLRVPLPEMATRGDIAATDLNNNAHDDVFVFINRDSESVRGVLFLSD
jgi:hypothetical protein